MGAVARLPRGAKLGLDADRCSALQGERERYGPAGTKVWGQSKQHCVLATGRKDQRRTWREARVCKWSHSAHAADAGGLVQLDPLRRRAFDSDKPVICGTAPDREIGGARAAWNGGQRDHRILD